MHIHSKTSKKVLLIMDNCGPHGTALVDPRGQVKVVFLPPNCTSVYQPMDSGVIAMLKKNYRYKLLHKMFEIFDERQVLRENARAAKMALGTMGLKEGFSPHVCNVMDIATKFGAISNQSKSETVGENPLSLTTISLLPLPLTMKLLQLMLLLLKQLPQTKAIISMTTV